MFADAVFEECWDTVQNKNLLCYLFPIEGCFLVLYFRSSLIILMICVFRFYLLHTDFVKKSF